MGEDSEVGAATEPVEADARQPDERLPPLRLGAPAPTPPREASNARGESRRERRERRGGKLSAPPAGLMMLADEERLLLQTPLRLNKADIYPSSAEPHFPIEAPAPIIGEIDASYIENPVEKTFRRVRPGAELVERAELPLATVDADGFDIERAPSGAAQGVALLLGLGLHLAQGALAGASLLQYTMAPWPDASATLIRPLAYAPLALPLQRTMSLLAGASFLGAVDLHAAAPRASSFVLMVFYALVVVTCVLQLPTDVGMDVGRKQRESVLMSTLAASSPNASAIVPYRPDLLPETQLETGGGFFSTALSASQFGFFQALVGVRAILSILAWLLACLLQSFPAFGVPPVTVEEFGDTRVSFGRW